jgi:type I restriction enzyme R subunit
MRLDERTFEAFIAEWLVARGGYDTAKLGTAAEHSKDFDPVRGLDLVELFAFIGATQPDEWQQLRKLHGGNEVEARNRFADRLSREIDHRGTVDVLRHGVVDLGVHIRLAFFRPAHGLTPLLLERYAANRLTVTRQLPFDVASTKTVDLCLFVNGLPVATAELKNETTGQDIEFAKHQYRHDRDPNNVTLGRRAIVHFAVDTQAVAMTTRLAGAATRFLPFNKGHDGGPGNPPNPDGHRTAYLWENVWRRDAWMDLLGRFVHVEKPSKGSKKAPLMIFPRYHQWDAVLRLEAGALEEGPGHDYLVQHSAGSGKSNTIAWLAHRLSTLHAGDDKVFDKVVVITDRRVLDKQLQDTIYQFEHAHGVVQKIGEETGAKSAQLAEALTGEQARIVITTLQTFPFVLDRVAALPNRNYSVIVDEAHSSQTGESAKDLKVVLSQRSGEEELSAAEAEDAGYAPEPVNPAEEALARAAAARAKQPNLSFFAFTATPKGRTLELFGRLDPETKRHEPFHLYPMRQAIEEGFILDVLKSYVTYETYWNISKAIEEDPAYDPSKAKAAIARFVSLHEHNLAQKAEVIVEHFRNSVAHRIGGKAKAMVVTASRLHAVRYKQALEKHIKEQGYDIGVLVAFSGTVRDGAAEWTESSMNGFPESQTANEFNTDHHHLLVVAEKFQTGFDQPLLYAMYVDKTLTGLAAVQTLSRLNRIHENKDGTFVLDFRNDADEIRKAFEPWYGKTVAPPTDPNLLYDTRHELDPHGVLWPEEVEKAIELLLTTRDHGRVHATLQPSIDRFFALDEDEQDRFRDALNRFVRIYSFLSQVVAFTDTKLERDYLFCKALNSFVKPSTVTGMDLGSQVELTALRMEKTFEGELSLTAAEGEQTTIFSGTGKQQQLELEPLSLIIAQLNERFGTDWAPEDRLFYDAVAEKLANRPDLQQKAAANDEENFGLVLGDEFMGGVVAQLDTSEDMALKFINDTGLRQAVVEAYLPLIYGKARVANQEHCPIGDLLGPDKESQTLEYKARLRTHAHSGEVYKPLETATLKTLVAFLNSPLGGTLLIGVDDQGKVTGLASDYASLRKQGKDDRDRFGLHLANICAASFGAAAAANISSQILTVDGHDLARVHVRPSGFPVDAEVTVDNKGRLEKKNAFYIRLNNGTVELDDQEKQKYVATRWRS